MISGSRERPRARGSDLVLFVRTTIQRSAAKQQRRNFMAENPNLNQTLDRRREEKVAEHLMQDNVSRLANIAVDGLEIQ